ncbi:MAG: DRTGG domain-containing protein [Promethearchaeota archaeon]
MGNRSILLTSTKKGSGKSVIAIGTFLKLKESGLNPGYFKPLGDSSTITSKNLTDKDVSVISSIVERKYSNEQICPQYLNPHYYLDEVLPQESKEVLEKIKDAYNHIASLTDFVIIEGNHNYMQYASINLDDIRIAKEIEAKIVICSPIQDDNDLNLVVAAYNYCKIKEVEVLGVIISAVKELAEQRIKKLYEPLLKSMGIRILGGLKNAKTLEKPTISEVMDAIDGKLLVGNFIKIKNNKINGFIVGAMADKAISYIQSATNLAVITGGDRTDISLIALETNIAVLIFTGNLQPKVEVLDKAREKGIPVILASSDTFTITEKLQTIHTKIKPADVELCLQQVDKNIDWEEFTK